MAKKDEKAGGRIPYTIHLHPKAQAALEAFTEAKGLKKYDLVTKLLTWFSEADERIQAGIVFYGSQDVRKALGESIARDFLNAPPAKPAFDQLFGTDSKSSAGPSRHSPQSPEGQAPPPRPPRHKS